MEQEERSGSSLLSGGLDKSYTVMRLTQEGYEVYAACANTGGFSDEQLKKNEGERLQAGRSAICDARRHTGILPEIIAIHDFR